MHMNTKYKMVLLDNADNLVLSKLLSLLLYAQNRQIKKNIFYWENPDFSLKVFYILICEFKSMSHILFDIIYETKKIPFFIGNKINSVSLELK